MEYHRFNIEKQINIQNNNKFKLQGYDVVTDLFLTQCEAALGKRVNID